MEPANNPFLAVRNAVNELSSKADIIIVDFHAEATSEKKAMGYLLDGKVNLVFGTHTHVQTADDVILPKGTAYITDIGMTGVRDSVLGVKKEIIMDLYYTRKKFRFEKAEGEVWFNGVIFDIDNTTKKVTNIESLYFSKL